MRPDSLQDLPSMRFELSDDPVGRATAIYERAFEADASGFAVAYLWRAADEAPFEALLPADSIVERATGANYWTDPDPNPDDQYVRLLAPLA